MKFDLKNIFHFFSRNNLQNKFILFFIILSSAPVLILGGISLYLINLSHRHDVSNLELQLIDQKIEEVKKFFADTSGSLVLHVSTDAPYIDQVDQVFILEGLLAENRALEEVSFIDLRGRETEKRVRSLKEDPELTDVSGLEKFKKASVGESYFGEVSYTLSGPFMVVASPVRNKNGEIIQVLSGVINLSSLMRSIKGAVLGSSGYLLLIDKDGTLISFPDQKISLKEGMNFAELDRVKTALEGRVFNALDPGDRYESMVDGTPVVGAGKKILGEPDWLLLAEWPVADADVVIQNVSNQIINLTLFSILAVLFIAPLFARRLVGPIRDLQRSAGEIAEGNFDKKVEIHTRDELEELGNSFNEMAKGLKRLQELKSEFVFIAAHELRTPVTAIKGYLSLLFEDSASKLSKAGRKYIDIVSQSNERLIQLVNDILEIARSEAGRLKVEVVPIDLRESIRAILTEVKPLADQKRINVSYEYSGDLPKVLGDQARVKEVIMNFISNAIKYNNEGGWVKIHQDVRENTVVTSIEDNGFGMLEEDKKHVFEKFFRSEEGKIKSIQGTGLGLFITKELTEKMQGRVWFESEEGKGSTFSFSLLKV